MKINFLYWLPLAGLLVSCETMQAPQQRRDLAAREQMANLHMEERIRRLEARVNAVSEENAGLVRELQQLRGELRACASGVAQLDGNMRALDTRQSQNMNDVVQRVEALIKKAISTGLSSATGSNSARGSGREHVVEAGHTLSAIASAYGTTVDKVKKANNLKSDTIQVGQRLFIPD